MSAVVVVGSSNLDFIIEVPVLPVAGQTVLGSDVVIRPGGKGANQAVAAQRLGADTTLVAAVGDDQSGSTLRAALAAEHLDLGQLATVDGPSGVALIVVATSAANQITVAPGANRRLSAVHLATLGTVLTPAAVLLVQLEIPTATCVAAARLARDAGATVVVNAAPPADPADPCFADLLALTDVLIVNEGEASSLSGVSRPPSDVDGWRELAVAIGAQGPPAVVVTLGDAGAVAAEGDASFFVPAFAVSAVDSTGAGDAFCGAVAAALAEKRALPEAVRRGCAAGALATTAVGAQAAMPDKAELERLDTGMGD